MIEICAIDCEKVTGDVLAALIAQTVEKWGFETQLLSDLH
jgi:hypothetical protein